MNGVNLKFGLFRPQITTIFILLPGLFLLGMGLLAILAPRLVITVMAILFVYFGILAISVAWKVRRFKKSLQESVFMNRGFSSGAQRQSYTNKDGSIFVSRFVLSNSDPFSSANPKEESTVIRSSDGVLEGEVLDDPLKAEKRAKKGRSTDDNEVDISKIILH